MTAIRQFNQPRLESSRATVGRVAYVEAAERFVREPPRGDDTAADREATGKRKAGCDLGARGRAVPSYVSGMRRHDVPEQDVLLELELAENAVHDRRRRFRGPASC